jgi:hypothetical protein
LFTAFVSDRLEALAFEPGELDAVRGVGDLEVEDGPDEGEAAGLAGEPADHLGAAFDLAERQQDEGFEIATASHVEALTIATAM